MERRGFLGLLAAIPLAGRLVPAPKPELVRGVDLAVGEAMAVKTELGGYSDISAALKEVYPPRYFEGLVERESPFRAALRRSR